jgi:hypothetical protein
MDVFEYVNTQANRAAAAITAYTLTRPTVETAADLYLTAKDYLGPTATAVMGLAWALYGPDSGTVMDTIAQSMGVVADPGLQFALAPVLDPAIDTVTDMADSYAMAGKREQEYLKPEQDAIARDPAKLEEAKQEEAKLEAQRQAGEQDSLSREQEADAKVAERLDEALRRDQEFRQQEQADKAALEKPAQEQNKEEQVQDPRLAA